MGRCTAILRGGGGGDPSSPSRHTKRNRPVLEASGRYDAAGLSNEASWNVGVLLTPLELRHPEKTLGALLSFSPHLMMRKGAVSPRVTAPITREYRRDAAAMSP